jgi:uncharacterized protein YndB with AHSA1/START domain
MADIKHAIQIAAKPETIYPLVATAQGLGQWWAADITESAGTVDLGFFHRATVYRLKLEIDRPPAQVEWLCQSGDEWGGTRILFRVEARGAGSLLRFTHAGWRTETDYFTSCNTTWGELMFRVKATAEGKSSGPLFLANDMAY